MFLLTLSSKTTSAILIHPKMYIETDSDFVNVNDTIKLYFKISEIENLFSLSLDFKFNTDLVEILSINPGSFFDNEPIEFSSRFSDISENSKTLNFYATFIGNNLGISSNRDLEIIQLKLKLLKECKIAFNTINSNNNIFIGTPNIRLRMIDNNLNIINTSSSTRYIETTNFKSDNEIREFISDVYKKTFSRDPDEYGFNYWYNKLISQEYSVRNFLINILNEKEFIEKNLSNEDFVTSMYSIIVNRDPDQQGYDYWLTTLIEYQKNTDTKHAKSRIILLMCNESELEERALKLNLKF